MARARRLNTKYTIAMNASTEIIISQQEAKKTRGEDKFQWRRVGMIARFYYPILRKQIICFPILTVICTFILALSIRKEESMVILLLCSLPIAGMYYFSPIGLARKDCRMLSDQLPVTASEKLVFLLLYFCICINLLTSGVMLLSMLFIYPLFPDLLDWLIKICAEFKAEMGFSVYNPGMLPTGWFMQFCTLYGVICSKKNRMIHGILIFVGSFLAFLLLSGFGGFFIGVFYGVTHNAMDPEAMKVNAALLLLQMTSAIGMLASMWLIWKIYKKLKYSGF